MADTHAPSEESRGGEGSRFRGDATMVRSTHGIEAVRQVTCVSNEIAVHALEVDVLPGPAWAQVASKSHARLSIALDAIGGGRIESRLKRDQAPVDGPFTMNFAPPGAEVWGYSDGIRRVRDIRLDFDSARVAEAVGEKLTHAGASSLSQRASAVISPGVWQRSARSLKGPACAGTSNSLTLAACIDFLRLGREDPERGERAD